MQVTKNGRVTIPKRIRLAAGIASGLAKIIESNADGVRDHNETLAIATLIRPHIGALSAIINEADEMTRPRD